ncbi:unnamed protein product, partial [Aureobasidium vineae]
MGKLIKNHLARLIVMTAATCKLSFLFLALTTLSANSQSDFDSIDHIAASLHGFFWPKFFFDFLTKNFDPAVKPVPILQTINLIFGFINLAWEWPLEFIAGTAIHRSLRLRILLLPLSSLAAVLLYQGTNPALYYIIGCGVYFWAYTEGEFVRSLGRYPDGQAIRNN